MSELGAQDSKTFGLMLQVQRRAVGKTQAQVAKEIGTRRQTIAALESGENVGVHVAFAALGALGAMVKVFQPKRPTLDEIRQLLPESAMDEVKRVPPMKLTARDAEALMLARCVEVARSTNAAAHDQKEANVFRVASMVVDKKYPNEARRLRAVSGDYFSKHPAEKLLAGDVVGKGWLFGLPRLRDSLSHELARG